MKKTTLSLACVALILSACGGSDDATALKAGEEFTREVSEDDTVIDTSTFRAYAVTTQGELSTDTANPVGTTLVPLLVERQRKDPQTGQYVKEATVPTAEQQALFKAIWSHLEHYYGTTNPQKLLAEIGDYDSGLWQLHSDYANSGMTMSEFVTFYEAIDDFPLVNTDTAESDLSALLQALGLNHRQLQDTLVSVQGSWRVLLGTMNARAHTFDDLRALYGQSQQAAEPFLRAYLQPSGTDALKADDDKGPAAVLKLAWQIIKDNKPQTEADGAFTRVLSSRDPSWEGYVGAKEGTSKQVSVKGKNALGMRLYSAKFALTGYYDAQNRNIGGSWMPLVRLDVSDMFAFFSWTLNAKASVTLPVNVGTLEAPIPVMPVYMELHEKGALQNYLEKFEFTAHGQNGFATKK
jgi:hypothetical protein